MIEFLKHFFGFCGEHWHPNIWTLLLGGVGVQQTFSYIKFKIKEYGKNQS